jgi:hypothetical protein
VFDESDFPYSTSFTPPDREPAAEEPRPPARSPWDVVPVLPRRVASSGWSVGEDVAVESVATERENLVPPVTLGGGGVEEDFDQVLDVRDPGGLKVEVGDQWVDSATQGSSTRPGQSCRRCLLRGGDVLPRRGVEKVLCLGNPASKCVSRRALVLPGKGSHTHALLGGCCLGLGGRKSRSKGAVGSGDMPRRKAAAENRAAAGGMPNPQRGESPGKRVRSVLPEEGPPMEAETVVVWVSSAPVGTGWLAEPTRAPPEPAAMASAAVGLVLEVAPRMRRVEATPFGGDCGHRGWGQAMDGGGARG